MTSDDTTHIEPSGKYHPVCLMLPGMTVLEYRELVEDIRERGQRIPIKIDAVTGDTLDGRHRQDACQELDRPVKFELFSGTEAEKVAMIMSENVHRRHLTTQQRAAIAAELATMKRGTRTDLAPSDAMSDAQAAKLMRVSEPTAERAKRRMREDPEAHALAKEGKLGRRKSEKANIVDERQRGPTYRGWFEQFRKIPPSDTVTPGVALLPALCQLSLSLPSDRERQAIWAGILTKEDLNQLVHELGPLIGRLGELLHVVKQERKRRSGKLAEDAPEAAPDEPLDDRTIETFEDGVEAATIAQEEARRHRGHP
jgi:ParB-like chromosome segregation protein Spo0J